MKNVTIALDDDTHRKARIRAAELGTSLSALVKAYLEQLTDASASAAGVREMPVAYKHPEPTKDGPPWFIDGKWSYTPDGKPRQPGALRDKLADLPDDWDEWPPEMLEFFDKLHTEPWDDDYDDPLPFDESQLGSK
jgi:hypothetical protein